MTEYPITEEAIEKLGFYIKRDLKVFSHGPVDDMTIDELVDNGNIGLFLDETGAVRYVRCQFLRDDRTIAAGLIEPKDDWPL